MPVSARSAVIDDLIGEGPDTLCDGESMVAFRREMARLEALMTTATARFDTARTWEADGAQTAAAPYSQGGPTTQTNGRVGCAYHNRLWFTRDP